MDTLSAFTKGVANRGKPIMVFDWIKAAQLIKNNKPVSASAGLTGDWEWTGGVIYIDDNPVDSNDTYTYLASTWSKPELEMDGIKQDCYIMKSKTEWGASTYWPQEAIDILNG